MPAVTFNLYDRLRASFFYLGNVVDFDNGTIKCAIVTGSYTPAQNTQDYWNDVSANEVSGAGYTAGGNIMANGTIDIGGSGNITVDFDNPATWTENASGFSNGRRAVVYQDTGDPATSRLIGYTDDFGSDQGNANGDFSVQINASGLINSARS